jgi:hypothetical protein
LSSQEKKDCYWFIKETENGRGMAALCVECGTKNKIGSFWEGSLLGYGDYDLQCDLCGTEIYLRSEKVDETTV